ncbi:DUF4099 domain-containing protein [Mucilaginibacter terrae]|uniref:DUF4099 domain-containing protein n=1 Tax=Mucilaginibacter terrae TaxID=1955052 RepID=A0ABU3GNF0_9SPHI|nr:DUF4099 domain-containing protein [Mucilaginibacter terrae]MDT3401296.1 hypothetical protein [Mucilaginibacter terrae]
MRFQRFKEKELPMQDLETIGLAAGGQLLLNVDDLKALLSGGRTSLMQLNNLEAENIKIKSLDAKLSLQPDGKGKVNLLIHPVYRRAVKPDFISEEDALQLQKGGLSNLLKVSTDGQGRRKELLVEYDADTREFIVSDVEKILAPDMVNGDFLTPAQKEAFRKGKEVQMPDHTAFAYTAVNAQGIRANKLALIASVLIDGGLSYALYKGLNALFNQKHDADAGKLSAGYDNAVRDMEEQVNFHHQEAPLPNRITR